MPRWIMLLVFAVLSLSFQILAYRYMWHRLVRDTRMPTPWRRVVTISLIILGLSFPLTMATSRLIGSNIGLVVGWPVFLWLGFAIFLLLGFLFIDGVRIARWSVRHGIARVRKQAPAETSAQFDPQRRQFFARIAGGAVVTAATGGSAFGAREALKPQNIVDVPVTLSRLPAALDGFTIAQITDVHIGYTITRKYVQAIVDRTNALKPDLIAITGDLVDGDVDHLRDAVAPIAELSAPHGVYFILGNHEYYSGPEQWIDELTRLGIRVLRNERVTIGQGDDSFDLAGIDDREGSRFGDDFGPDLAKALDGRDPLRELVLLAHQPRQVFQAKRHGVGLQLSGHTHGGQVWPWHYIVKIQQRGLLAGLSRHGDTQLYISRGTGYWGPPLRICAPAEISRITLRAEILRADKRGA